MTRKSRERWICDLPAASETETAKEKYFITEVRGNDILTGWVRIALSGNQNERLRGELSPKELRDSLAGSVLNEPERIEWREAPWEEVLPIAYALLKACLMAREDSEEG